MTWRRTGLRGIATEHVTLNVDARDCADTVTNRVRWNVHKCRRMVSNQTAWHDIGTRVGRWLSFTDYLAAQRAGDVPPDRSRRDPFLPRACVCVIWRTCTRVINASVDVSWSRHRSGKIANMLWKRPTFGGSARNTWLWCVTVHRPASTLGPRLVDRNSICLAVWFCTQTVPSVFGMDCAVLQLVTNCSRNKIRPH